MLGRIQGKVNVRSPKGLRFGAAGLALGTLKREREQARFHISTTEIPRAYFHSTSINSNDSLLAFPAGEQRHPCATPSLCLDVLTLSIRIGLNLACASVRNTAIDSGWLC